MKVITVDSVFDDMRLDRFLRKNGVDMPQSRIERAIRNSQIMIDNKKSKSNVHVRAMQKVSIHDSLFIDNPVERDVSKVNIGRGDMNMIKEMIIEDNDDFLVIDKPYGLSVQDGTCVNKNIDDMLSGFFKDCTPKLVHRLDKTTSGVMVIAKNNKVAKDISDLFKNRAVTKKYFAVVNNFYGSARDINVPLREFCIGGERIVKESFEDGIDAQTHVECVNRNNRYQLLLVSPITGRKHQIRAHLSYIQSPVFGDKKYGGFPYKRVCLHAHAIEIPGYGVFFSELPDDMLSLFNS